MSDCTEFQHWYAAMRPDIAEHFEMLNSGKRHASLETEWAWQAWQAARAQGAEPVEWLGNRCIDGGRCHHSCEKSGECFRRTCCEPFSDYSGPWKYPQPVQQGSVPEAKAIINRVVEELENGFVACERCGDQEDTATLDCMTDLRKLQGLLSTATTPQADGWVSFELGYPEGEVVWYWDSHQGVMLVSSDEAIRRGVRSPNYNPHWMPTGLKRPQPPKEQ